MNRIPAGQTGSRLVFNSWCRSGGVLPVRCAPLLLALGFLVLQALAPGALAPGYVISGALAADGKPWKAGAAKIRITPEKLIWMSGYGSRDRPAEGKLTDLWAKALVLEDPAGKRAVTVTLDLVGIDRGMSLSIGERLEKAYGLQRHQVALCTSHTHTGPAVGRNLGAMLVWRLNEEQLREIDEYTAWVVENVTQVVGEAIGKLEDVQLTWGNGTATFAVNRRTNTEPTVPEQRTAGMLKGPSDHDVPVLAARNAAGQLTAVLFGYACHCTVLPIMQWTGDYAGYAQIELEASHPGAVALFWAGCGGDQNPLPRRTVEHARHYGRRLADAVDAVLLTSKMREVQGQLTTRYREINLAFGPLPDRARLEEELASKDKFLASRAKLLLAQIDAGTPLSQTYPYPVATWRVGSDIEWIILGGEVVVDYALRLKTERRGIGTWVAGYSNDVMAYIPSRRVLTEGGYEGGGSMVYYGQPTVWAPEVEETIVKEVHEQLGAN